MIGYSPFIGGCILLISIFELGLHVWYCATIPTPSEIQHAVNQIRSGKKTTDLVITSPAWNDPVLRWQLGEVIGLDDAGRRDLSSYGGLWTLDVGKIGGVGVRYQPLPKPTVAFDFVAQLHNASVTLVTQRGDLNCPWTRFERAQGGWLGQGPMAPSERFLCSNDQPWLWVGVTTFEDLSLLPRRCVWQHPAQHAVVRTRFKGVPYRPYLVVYTGLDYHAERMREGAPVVLQVKLGEHLIGNIEHHDGEGWRRDMFEVPAAIMAQHQDGEVGFEVSSPEPHRRLFCWAAAFHHQLPESDQ